MHGATIDTTTIVVENETSFERASHPSILPGGLQVRSGTVVTVKRMGLMLAVALPLAAADLVVKARLPTPPWGYHERSLGWLLLSMGLFVLLLFVTRIPSAVIAPAAGLMAAGLLGNSLSALWNGMEVPNPLVATGESRAIAYNPADVFALSGMVILLVAIAVWLIGNRELIPPPDEVRSSRGRAFGRLFE